MTTSAFHIQRSAKTHNINGQTERARERKRERERTKKKASYQIFLTLFVCQILDNFTLCTDDLCSASALCPHIFISPPSLSISLHLVAIRSSVWWENEHIELWMLRCAYLLLLHQILKRSILDRIITRNSQHLKVIPTRSVAPMVDRFGCCGLCVCRFVSA